MRFRKALLAATIATMLSGAALGEEKGKLLYEIGLWPEPSATYVPGVNLLVKPKSDAYVTISPVAWFGDGAVFLLKFPDGRMAAVSNFLELTEAMVSMSEEPTP